MGRRAAPRINPNVDYSRQLVTLEQLAPWNPQVLFGRAAPLEIEIGSGKGLFLSRAGAERPDHDFLGIEVAHKYAESVAARAAKGGLNNVRVVCTDAARLLRELVPDSSVAAVHIYFPDPWWKARHKKRRIVNPGVVTDVERILALGGRLHFWTDVEEYYQTGVEIITAHSKLSGPQPVPESPAEHQLDYRTHRERRVRMEGGEVYRSEFEKVHAGISSTDESNP